VSSHSSQFPFLKFEFKTIAGFVRAYRVAAAATEMFEGLPLHVVAMAADFTGPPGSPMMTPHDVPPFRLIPWPPLEGPLTG
jgi:hypothetical protein